MLLKLVKKILCQFTPLLSLFIFSQIFRHGDRAPTKFYPNDPYINDFDKLWPEGFAQLTNVIFFPISIKL